MKTTLFLLLCGIAHCFPENKKPNDVGAAAAVETAPPTPDTIGFTAQILPILPSKCRSCHFPGGTMYGKMPFGQSATIPEHSEGILGWIKDKEEGRLCERSSGKMRGERGVSRSHMD